jgi:hypothetical protein
MTTVDDPPGGPVVDVGGDARAARVGAVRQRKMAGEMVRKNAYYRCAARTLAPGSAALADHPSTVNLREDVIVDALNRWIGRLFHPENVDHGCGAARLATGGLRCRST